MFYAHVLRENWEYTARTHTYVRDDLYLIRSKQRCREYSCNVWLYHACSYTVGSEKAMNLAPLFEDIKTTFFLLSVLDNLEKE